ncbi:signaling lymphocytic activation molecule-like [Labeo rohita]|uniref:signaling lymphocytic activation molecule-like n=1 Tax=Labeo rohita TaxID=84645 RepID=UPI0021E1F1C7|nr:signaling lymphocytic activation molecule-like [Labeo rohita]
MDGNQILFTFENQNQSKTAFAQIFCKNGVCLKNVSDPRAIITVGENTIFSLSNVNTSDSGRYSALFNGLYILWTLPVKVYASLALPDITLELSSTHCMFLCSVEYGENLTLSWYNTTSLVSNNSTLNGSKLLLPLEIKPDDNNNYTCVATNPVDNQTVILMESCKSELRLHIIICSVIGIVILICISIVFIYRRCKKRRTQQPNRDEKEMKTFLSQDPQREGQHLSSTSCVCII